DEGLWNGAAIHGHELPRRARTQTVDSPRDELLSRAGLPLDKDCEGGTGHCPHRLYDFLDLRACAHQVCERAPQTERPATFIREGLDTVVSATNPPGLSVRW